MFSTMLKQRQERRAQTRRYRVAMEAARKAHSTATIYRSQGRPTVEDVIHLAYGACGIRLTEDEVRDALAAELAEYGLRLGGSAA